jgi:hypothetical protein
VVARAKIYKIGKGWKRQKMASPPFHDPLVNIQKTLENHNF